MNGPVVMLFVAAIAGAAVFVYVNVERIVDERRRRRWDLEGVDDWERTKRDLPFPRSLP